MASLDYYMVDAFTQEPFGGNPAAVVLGADALEEEAMQRIAAEFNLSETAFLSGLHAAAPSDSPVSDRGIRLRWFTSQCEVGFCGHATLAAAHAIWESRGGGDQKVCVQSAAGELTVQVERRGEGRALYWLRMPPPGLRECTVPCEELLEALRVPRLAEPLGPVFQTRDGDVLLVLSGGNHVRALQPDLAQLEQLSHGHQVRGVCVASPDTGDPGIACISRFFAPASGIDEDPVTGSVHGPLAAVLIRGGRVAPSAPGRWSFRCRQVPGNGRVGDVYVRAESRNDQLEIEVGGHCVTVMTGRIIAI